MRLVLCLHRRRSVHLVLIRNASGLIVCSIPDLSGLDCLSVSLPQNQALSLFLGLNAILFLKFSNYCHFYCHTLKVPIYRTHRNGDSHSSMKELPHGCRFNQWNTKGEKYAPFSSSLWNYLKIFCLNAASVEKCCMPRSQLCYFTNCEPPAFL